MPGSESSIDWKEGALIKERAPFLGAKFSFPLFLSLLILLFVPHLLFVQTSASSLAFGLIVASLLVVVLNFNFVLSFRVNLNLLIVGFAFYGFILFGGLYEYTSTQITKPFFTSIAIILPFSACLLLSRRLIYSNHAAVENTFLAVFLIVFFFGWVEVIYGLRFLDYDALKKPVFPFSEESHYALAVGPLACAAAVNKSVLFKLLVLLSTLAQSVLFPNLTLLVFFVLMCFVFWGARHLFWVLILSCAVVAGASFFYFLYSDSPTVEYFSSRLIVSAESNNLTTLVFLQGWDEAWNSLVSTQGLGLGFQMLGTNPPGTIADRITMLYGSDFNRADGGFLASKIISELGVIGVLVALLFVLFVFNYILKAGGRYGGRRDILFYTTFIFAYLVEFFLRGYGYFSPGLTLTLAFALTLYRKKWEVKFD